MLFLVLLSHPAAALRNGRWYWHLVGIHRECVFQVHTTGVAVEI